MKLKVKRIISIALVCATLGFCACNGGQSISESSSAGPSVIFEVPSVEIFEGDTYTLEYSLNEVESTALSWRSTNESVVMFSVTEMGIELTALAVGEASIIVSSGEVELSSIDIVVKEYPLSVLVPEGKLVLRRNRTATVKAYFTEDIASNEVEWTTSDPTVAIVEYQGLTAIVTSVARGECEITVRVGQFHYSFTLIVGIT